MTHSIGKGKGAWRGVTINRMVRVSLIERGTFELRPEGGLGSEIHACMEEEGCRQR